MDKEIVIDNLKIHYDETGPLTGQEVILMHGWGCNTSTVRSIAAALENSLHIYNIDLPGHGKSQEPPSVWGIEDFTHLIETFAQQLQIKRPTLIGHSFGGRIAILMASRSDISKVVLVDAAGIKPKRSIKYYLKVYSFKTGRKIASLLLPSALADKIIEGWRNKNGSADYQQASPIMRAVMSKCVNEDLKYVMPDISAPTLLIWGRNDTATPLQDAHTMESLIPDSGLVTFDGCGHYSFLDNPYGFRKVLCEFLKDEMSLLGKA